MRKLVITLAFILIAASANAQTHPCDKPDLSTLPRQNSLVGTPFVFNVCIDVADNPTGIVVYVNGVRNAPIGLTPGGTTIPNAVGLVPYLVSLNLAKGNYSITASVTNLAVGGATQEGAQHSPFGLDFVDPIITIPLPKAPKPVSRTVT